MTQISRAVEMASIAADHWQTIGGSTELLPNIGGTINGNILNRRRPCAAKALRMLLKIFTKNVF